jgi:uncharacterized protein YjbI with pentapeptide repeats
MAAKSSPKDYVIETTVSTRVDIPKAKRALAAPPPEIIEILKQDEIDNVVLSGYDLRGISLAGKKLTDCDISDSLVFDLTDATLSGCNVSGTTAQHPDGTPGGKLDRTAFHSCYSGGEARPFVISESTVSGMAIMGCLFEWIKAERIVGDGVQIGARSNVSHGVMRNSFLPGLDGSKSNFSWTDLENVRTTHLDPEEIRKMTRAQVEAIPNCACFDSTEFHGGSLRKAVMPKLAINSLVGADFDLTDAVIPGAFGRLMAVSLIVSKDTCLNFCEFPSLKLLGERENPFGTPRDVTDLKYEIFDLPLTPQRFRKGQDEEIRDASRKGLREKHLIAARMGLREQDLKRIAVSSRDNQQKKKPDLDLD